MKSLLLLFILLNFLHAHGYTIAVDPGHGGEDTGASHKKIHESHVVLNIAKYLTEYLNRDKDFNAFMVRQEDLLIPLKQRVHMAKKKKAELFVSIHANSSPDTKSTGMEVYIRNELEPDEDSLRLANQENNNETISHVSAPAQGDVQSILSDLKRSSNLLKSYELGWHMIKKWQAPFSRPRDHAINQGPFYVLQQDEIPSVLIEVGFLTNDKEAQRLSMSSYQKELARSIYVGLKDFKETLDNQQSKALK